MSEHTDAMNRTAALADLARRGGAARWTIHHTEEGDGPVVWVAVAEMRKGYGREPIITGSGIDPYRAAHDLAERILDGGQCAHCLRVIVVEEHDAPVGGPALLPESVTCPYAYDPELKTYRRGCEGE